MTMGPMGSLTRRSAVALVAVLALCGCGSDGSSRQALLDTSRADYGSPGLAVALRRGTSSWFGASGTATTSGVPLHADSRFRVASITKTVVAFLVVDAERRGELSLDRDVSDLMPEVPPTTPPTTIRMLLNHTSGIFNVGDEGDVMADIASLPDATQRAAAMDLADRFRSGEQVTIPGPLFVALALTHDRYFAPGTGYHYSNANYQLAAMVLERVTGTPLPDLLTSRLVAPLHLHRTTVAVDHRDPPEMRGYTSTSVDGSLVDATDELAALGNGGSGGVVSTPEELLTIVRAVVTGTLLPPALAAEMRRGTPQSDSSYGLGIATYRFRCGTFFGHGGAMSGTRSLAVVSEDGASGVVIAANILGDGDAPDLLPLAEALLCPSA